MRRVTIIQEVLAQYRLGFYEQLRTALGAHDIELQLVHGSASGDRAERNDEANLPWAIPIRNRVIGKWRGRSLVWQSALRHITQSDLVILEQANRQLINYPILAFSRGRFGPRVAFWGHGANLQTRNPDGPAEKFKRWTTKLPHWWFAYTNGSAERVRRTGFPADRITVVQNAVDTSDYLPGTITKLPYQCIFLGSLHEHKRIGFLLQSAAEMARLNPEFRLVVVGDGSLRPLVERVASSSPWITYRGALFGSDKAAIVAESSLMLMPGLVGLAILDSFAAQTPLVTTNVPWHSPEFEYATNGVNAVVLPADSSPIDFANAVHNTLLDSSVLRSLRDGCQQSASDLTLEEMVQRYAAGIRLALEIA